MSLSYLFLIAAASLAALSTVLLTLEVQTIISHHMRRLTIKRRVESFAEGDRVKTRKLLALEEPRLIQAVLLASRLSHASKLKIGVDAGCKRIPLSLQGPQPFDDMMRIGETCDGKPEKRNGAKLQAIDNAAARLLARAALEGVISSEDILRAQCLCAALFGIIFTLCSTILAPSVLLIFAMMAAGIAIGFRFPWDVIKKEADRRVAACVDQLPDMVEVLALGSAAGVSFSNGVELYCARFDGELSCEMRKVFSAWRVGGISWKEALEDFGRRMDAPAISQFVSTVTQALRMGTPLSELLETQGEEARRAKKMQAEERIEKAPVKMLLPMGTLILPAMLLLILGPVLLGMSSGS